LDIDKLTDRIDYAPTQQRQQIAPKIIKIFVIWQHLYATRSGRKQSLSHILWFNRLWRPQKLI